jgi:tetratricopeptide (TPR) repeat protein
MLAGQIELIAGNPAAAERVLTEGRQALPQQEASGYLSGILVLLAEAVYEQGRLSEAWQLTEQAKTAAGISDQEVQTRWRATRAKMLARQGQHAAARQLITEAVALVAGSSQASLLAETLVASAEVSRLAGSHAEAAASLRQALRIYQDRGAIPLAARTQDALASLAARPLSTGQA